MIDDLFVGKHDHPRVSGNGRRAWGLGLIGVALLVVAFACMAQGSKPRASDAWALAFFGPMLLSIGAFALAVREFRRPVLTGWDGRGRNRKIAGAELRWHPEYPQIYDEISHKVARVGSKGRRVGTELLIGETTARVIFDGAPFRAGTRAAMWFSARAPRARFDPGSFDFRLRCSRERPAELLRLNPSLVRLADLKPDVFEYDESKERFRLEFALPQDAPGADLLLDTPVYWELTYVIEDGGSRYAGRFFVPVSP